MVFYVGVHCCWWDGADGGVSASKHGSFLFVVGCAGVVGTATEGETGKDLLEAMFACGASVFSSVATFFDAGCSFGADARVGAVDPETFEERCED